MTTPEEIADQLNTSRQDIDVRAAELIHSFQVAGGAAKRDKAAREIVTALAYLIFSVPYRVGESAKLYRGRPVPNHKCCFDRGSAFGPPPIDIAGPGRANRANAPVFYAAMDTGTVIEELRTHFQNPDEIRAFNSCEVVPKEGRPAYFLPVGEIDHIRRFGRSILPVDDYQEFVSRVLSLLRHDVRRAAQLADAFFADEFQKPDTGNTEQYVVTGAIADEFYPDDRLDGILYPSVAHRGGLNVAIKPSSLDEKFEFSRYEAYAVTRYLGYGIAAIRSYATADTLKDNGQVNWRFSPTGNAKICIPDSGKL